MPVKQIRSATRVLVVFEGVVAHQPVGVGALARLLDDDKSAVQRALMTLAEAGWIRRSGGNGALWEASARLLALSSGAAPRDSLRQRSRPVLERLRDETGETAILNDAESGQIVVVDVAESNKLLRTVPRIGLIVPWLGSAAGQSILACLSDEERRQLVGAPVTETLIDQLADVRGRGWSINHRDVTPGASGVGAAIIDSGRRPVAALTISGPADRLPLKVLDNLGPVVAAAARSLSES